MKQGAVYHNFDCVYIPAGTLLKNCIIPDGKLKEMKVGFQANPKEETFCVRTKVALVFPVLYGNADRKSRKKNLLHLFRFVFPKSKDKNISHKNILEIKVFRTMLQTQLGILNIPGFFVMDEKKDEMEMMFWYQNQNVRDFVSLIGKEDEMMSGFNPRNEIQIFKVGEQLPGFRCEREEMGMCAGNVGGVRAEVGKGKDNNGDDPF